MPGHYPVRWRRSAQLIRSIVGGSERSSPCFRGQRPVVVSTRCSNTVSLRSRSTSSRLPCIENDSE